MNRKATAVLLSLALYSALLSAAPSQQQLARWLTRFPDADTNRDGRLTAQEANTYWQKLKARKQKNQSGRRVQGGVRRDFHVDPGWNAGKFPDHAVCYRTPAEIKTIYAALVKPDQDAVTSYPEQGSGALRIVGTGHSFMAPGYKTFPVICRAAGFEQPLFTHTGGGMTGSARYKWEQENGIFQFDRNPKPRLLASIANAEWDAMMWGPYYNDRPEYYTCWIEFCLKYNPQMTFYLSDSWPQLEQLDEIPTSEEDLTAEAFVRLGKQKNDVYVALLEKLNAEYDDKVFILPTCDAMVLAVQHYFRGELPGIEGINRSVGKRERSLWRDRLGHLGPGFERLEGYVFYATIYGRSPALIEGDIPFKGNGEFPSRELDRIFRRIAWQATIGNPLTGVTDRNGNGVADGRE